MSTQEDTVHAELPPPEPFIVEGACETRVDVKADLAALIRRFPSEYAAVDIRGYQSWERPMTFLYEFLAEQDSGSFWMPPEVDTGWTDFEFNERGRWTAERFEALCAVCPEARL